MFTGQLTDCRIESFEEIADKKTGEVSHFAVVRQQWGEKKWVRLLDPALKKNLPLMKVGTAFLELRFAEKDVVNSFGGQREEKKELLIVPSCMTDFQPVK